MYRLQSQFLILFISDEYSWYEYSDDMVQLLITGEDTESE